MNERYFYHSFPRRAGTDVNGKGLSILRSLASSGLLLTPERTVWSEFMDDGGRSSSIEVFQKRTCFTELAPEELGAHAVTFGPFAIEFEIQALRQLGAIPVFYFPATGIAEQALAGLAAALVARMAEVQQVLSRLQTVSEIAARTSNKTEIIEVTMNGQPAGATRCTVGAAEDILAMLLHQSRPVGELLGAWQALTGFFYPTENVEYTTPLAYYRQREWRIVANMVHRGQPMSRELTGTEVEALIDMDDRFFARRMRFPSGEHRVVDQCQYFERIGARHFLSWARRVVVPDEVVDEAKSALRSESSTVPVVGASSLGAPPERGVS